MPSRTRSPLPDPVTPEAPPGHGATALQVLAPGQAQVSAAGRAFNLQLTRIDKLKRQLADLDVLGQTHRADLQRWVAPLQKQHGELVRSLVHQLDELLKGKSLSRLQRETAQALLCRWAQVLADEGDATMVELHDRHSRRTLAQKKQDAADDLRTRMEQVLGEPLTGMDEDVSVETLLRAGMERLRQSQAEGNEKRRAAAQARKARKKPSAVQVQQAEQQVDADSSLRKLFRQLASALHPDRETDAQERQRKNALMSEANAAYARKDLVTLMQIQLQAELADPLAASSLADDKLAALTLLLKQQVADLERERAARQNRLSHEFDMPSGAAPNLNSLKQHLLRQVATLESDVEEREAELSRLEDDARLKRWLNELRSQPAAASRADRNPEDFY